MAGTAEAAPPFSRPATYAEELPAPHSRWREPARNREYRSPRIGRSHFGSGGSGGRSLAATYPHRPHKWTASPDSGRTGGSLRARRIASPHWGQSGAVSGSFGTSIEGLPAAPGGRGSPSCSGIQDGSTEGFKFSTIPLRGQERLSEGGRLGSFGEVLHRRGHTSWSGLAAALNRTGIFGGPTSEKVGAMTQQTNHNALSHQQPRSAGTRHLSSDRTNKPQRSPRVSGAKPGRE